MSDKPYMARLSKSTREGKKWMVEFYNKEGKKIKTTHFGQDGSDDYTTHKDTRRKYLYLMRHEKNEDWDVPMSAGALSRWILWNKPKLYDSWKDYLEIFNLKDYSKNEKKPI